MCRGRWPRGLRRGTEAARLLGLRVRIPPDAWMSVSCECSVLSSMHLRAKPNPRPQYYRGWPRPEKGCGATRKKQRFPVTCGNKMPTRRNRGFYCRSYCLLNMFRAPLCPSSGAQEYYTVVAACGISCCGFQVAGLVWS